jgi:hypothetical protein
MALRTPDRHRKRSPSLGLSPKRIRQIYHFFAAQKHHPEYERLCPFAGNIAGYIADIFRDSAFVGFFTIVIRNKS